MKKSLITLCAVVAMVGSSFGQGRVLFNNLTGGAGAVSITSNPLFAHAGEGAAGANVGATYNAQLIWAPQASYGSLAALMGAAVGSSSAATFFATTGDSVNGAGFFDGGTVPNPIGTSMPVANYTMTTVAWYNGGTFSTYAAAASGGANIGNSAFFNLASTASPTPANNTVFSAFTVATVPEPGTLALLGLGAASLALFRRRKA